MANGMKMSYHTKNDEHTNNRALSVCSTKRNMNAHPKNQFLSAFCERKYPFYHSQVHIDAQIGWSWSCSCMVWCVLRWVICYALITMNSGKYLLVFLLLLLMIFFLQCVHCCVFSCSFKFGCISIQYVLSKVLSKTKAYVDAFSHPLSLIWSLFSLHFWF